MTTPNDTIDNLREQIAAAEDRGAWATAGRLKLELTRAMASAPAAPVDLAAVERDIASAKSAIAELEAKGQYEQTASLKSRLVYLVAQRARGAGR